MCELIITSLKANNFGEKLDKQHHCESTSSIRYISYLKIFVVAIWTQMMQTIMNLLWGPLLQK